METGIDNSGSIIGDVNRNAKMIIAVGYGKNRV